MKNKTSVILLAVAFFVLLSGTSLLAQQRYKVVYATNITGNEDIYLMILDEDLTIIENRRLTDWPTHDNFPIWSKDGKWIAFHSKYDGADSIWIMDEYGHNLRKFPNSSGLVDNPYVWSLDGNSIFGIHASAGDGEVAQFDLLTEEARMLTALPGLNTQSFDLNFDQTKIAFVRGAEGNGWTNGLFVADFVSNGQDFINKYSLPSAVPAPHWPRFSPDGTRIAFTIEVPPQDKNIGIGIINADGSDFWVPVAPAYNQFILHPKWLDDNRLIFNFGPRETGEIYVLDLMTLNYQRITYTPSPHWCAWPDVFLEMRVDIDIKPGSYPNTINLKSLGTVPVAILGSSFFDVRTVVPLTVTFAGAPVALKGDGTPMAAYDDVNDDGLVDLVVHFEIPSLVLSEADEVAYLEGRTQDDKKIKGKDAVRVIQ